METEIPYVAGNRKQRTIYLTGPIKRMTKKRCEGRKEMLGCDFWFLFCSLSLSILACCSAGFPRCVHRPSLSRLSCNESYIMPTFGNPGPNHLFIMIPGGFLCCSCLSFSLSLSLHSTESCECRECVSKETSRC